MRRTTSRVPRVRVSAALALAVAACLAGCSGSDSSGSGPSDSPGSPSSAASATSATGVFEPLDLSLLVYNVEYGGTRHSDAVMADLDADVVGVLESYNRLPAIAKAAGYPYYDLGLQILSKYPILEPSGADGLYAYIEVRPGQVVAMVNTHLDYVHDGPNRLDRGVSVSKVLATERQDRLSSIEKLLPSTTRLLGQGWPVFLTGDLNEPSHLDWTPATASQHRGVGAVAWPVSKAILATGMHDSFRVAHPDPVTVPGNTWGHVAGRKDSTPRRIDYAYVGGPVTVRSSEVVGERGGPGVDLGYPKWTSDHRAVLSQLTVTPVPMPTTLALSSRMLTVGDSVTATYQLPVGTDGGTVRVSGAATASYDVTGSSGTVKVDTATLRPGAVSHRPGQRGRREGGGQRVLRPAGAREGPAEHRCRDVRPGPADHRAVDRRPGQPLGLDRLLPGGRGRPEQGRLPDLGLHRRARCRRATAQHAWADGVRPRAPGQALAVAAGPLRRALPADRPVRQCRPHLLGGPVTAPRRD